MLHFVAGHNGLVGKAIVRALRLRNEAVITVGRNELDLSNGPAVEHWFREYRPDIVHLAAAKVGGIAANIADPVGFLVENLAIQNAVMTAAAKTGVTTTVFFASSCIYPRDTKQPMNESQLWKGPLEPTNESYAVAKLAGVQLARSLHAQYDVMHVVPVPCNVYGPGDHFDFERSHVVSALVRRFVEATHAGDESVTLWGTGNARRELLHCDDLAEATLYLLENNIGPDPVNVGTGSDVSIRKLATLIAELTGFEGRIEWDASRPDGMPQKLLDVSQLDRLGWKSTRHLEDGLLDVINDYLSQHRPSER